MYSSDEEADRKWESTNNKTVENIEAGPIDESLNVERSFNQSVVKTPTKQEAIVDEFSQDFTEVKVLICLLYRFS